MTTILAITGLSLIITWVWASKAIEKHKTFALKNDIHDLRTGILTDLHKEINRASLKAYKAAESAHRALIHILPTSYPKTENHIKEGDVYKTKSGNKIYIESIERNGNDDTMVRLVWQDGETRVYPQNTVFDIIVSKADHDKEINRIKEAIEEAEKEIEISELTFSNEIKQEKIEKLERELAILTKENQKLKSKKR